MLCAASGFEGPFSPSGARDLTHPLLFYAEYSAEGVLLEDLSGVSGLEYIGFTGPPLLYGLAKVVKELEPAESKRAI